MKVKKIILFATLFTILTLGFLIYFNNFIKEDSCLDSGGRYDRDINRCTFTTNANGTSPYKKIYGCDVDKLVALSEEMSESTLCKRTTVSSYPESNLIVLDRIKDNKYTIRILESSFDQKELYREEVVQNFPFDMYFSYFPGSVNNESIVIVDNNGPKMVGFPHRDENGYSIVWKL